jgi:hypothetical protein
LYPDLTRKENLVLAIDVATWSPLWDFNMLGKTSVDKIYTMQTYSNNITYVEQEVKLLVTSVGSKAAIGFDSDITGAETLSHVLPILESYNIQDIGVWRDNNVVENDWWKFITAFLK